MLHWIELWKVGTSLNSRDENVTMQQHSILGCVGHLRYDGSFSCLQSCTITTEWLLIWRACRSKYLNHSHSCPLNHNPLPGFLLLPRITTSDNESQLVGNTSKYCMRAELCKPKLWAGSAHYVFICQGRGRVPAKCVEPQRYANADECWQPVNCHSAHLPASWDSSGFLFFSSLHCLLTSRSSALMHTNTHSGGTRHRV